MRRELSAGTALRVWLAAVAVMLSLIAGFIVGVDPQSYFGLNRIGLFGGREEFLKASLLRRGGYDAILLGDSRMAFVDTGLIDGWNFVNAAVGGGSIIESARMLRQSELRGVKVVVLGFDIRQTANCGGTPEAWGGVTELLRYGLTWDQLRLAVLNVDQWLDGALPRHRRDGSRLTDQRTSQPPDWNGEREQRYREQIADLATSLRGNFGKFDDRCAAVIADMSDYVRSRNAEFIPVLIPINLEAIESAGLDREQISALVRDNLSSRIAGLVDLTASDFSNPRNFGPQDALHFTPTTGAAVIGEALSARLQ